MDENNLTADLVILGHVARDINVINDTEHQEVGGAVYYGGIAASHMGLKVFVITRLKQEDFPLLKEFEKYGIHCHATPSSGTSGIQNIYESSNMEERVCKPLDFAGEFTKEEIPSKIKAKFFVLAPILAGEINKELLEFLHENHAGRLCLDIQGFIRQRDLEEN